MNGRLAVVIWLGLLGSVSAHRASAEENFSAVTDEMLSAPAAENWLSYRGNLASWGHNRLQHINVDNVDALSLAWVSNMKPGYNEITPLVNDGVLYLANVGDVVQAMDARNGDVLWEYRREQSADAARGPRNIAIYDNKILLATQDAQLIALDARNGELLWETPVGDPTKMWHSGGPIVANGKVFTGRSCGIAVAPGCFIAAHDVNTGKELWRRYVIPRPGEPGDDTWGGLPLEERRHAGAWGVGSFDSELNLLYWGTSTPTPVPEIQRGTVKHDALYTNSTLALDADTGEIVWYFQHLPRPNWDFDHVFERILVDSQVRPDSNAIWEHNPEIKRGNSRKLMTGIPGKTGIVWTLDRATGEFLWAKETIKQNVTQAIDPASGKVTVNEAVIPDHVEDPYGMVCPSAYGGKNWMPGAYNPTSNALYMSLQNTCMEPEISKDNPAPRGEGYGII